MKHLHRLSSSVFKYLLGFSLIAASGLISVSASPIVSDSGHKAIDLTEDVWHFELDDIEGAEAIDFDVSYWHRVSIPHTWNAFDAQDGEPRASELRPAGYRLGVGWYRQEVPIPQDYVGQRTFIRFEGASVVKDLYVNGAHVGQHKGSFAAFCFEITDYVKPGESATIAVRVDNTRRQGRDYTEQRLAFSLKQLDIAPLKGDFNLYGGIYRGVELLTKPAIHISPTDYASPGVYVSQTEVSADAALLNIETVVSGAAGAEPADLVAELLDAEGRRVATAQRSIIAEAQSRHALALTVDAPRLWNGIADPYRYTLKVRVTSSEGQSDEVVQKIGVRSLVYEEGVGFVLNGEPIQLRGVNRHQDWQDRGWALTRRHHEIDFNLIKEIGSNAVRLAHYPQDTYVLELCDRLGLITFIEIPWVGLTYDNEAFGENLKRQTREMIRQHFNRAGIPMWGLWNELLHRAPEDTPNPMPLLRELNAIVHEEDPLRPSIGAASDGSSKVEGLRDVTDLLSWNLYPGWYGDSYPDEMTAWINERVEADGRDLVGISEYGAGASIYQHEDWSTLSKPKAAHPWHPEEWQAYFHERTWAAIAASDKLWGSFVWNMFDFAADHRDEGDREGINDKGLVTHDRKVKKDAFYFYQATWTDEPVVHITSRRFSPRLPGRATLKVYSNAESLAVTVNGQLLGPARRDGVIHVWDALELELGSVDIEAVGTFGGEAVTDNITWEVVEALPERFTNASPIERD